MAEAPTGYSATQISLHWAVVLLVAFQYLAHDGIEASWQERNQPMPTQIMVLTYLHIAAGITIFLLASARVYLRVTARRAAPSTRRTAAAALLGGNSACSNLSSSVSHADYRSRGLVL